MHCILQQIYVQLFLSISQHLPCQLFSLIQATVSGEYPFLCVSSVCFIAYEGMKLPQSPKPHWVLRNRAFPPCLHTRSPSPYIDFYDCVLDYYLTCTCILKTAGLKTMSNPLQGQNWTEPISSCFNSARVGYKFEHTG